jgi:hypothetical protein
MWILASSRRRHLRREHVLITEQGDTAVHRSISQSDFRRSSSPSLCRPRSHVDRYSNSQDRARRLLVQMPSDGWVQSFPSPEPDWRLPPAV